MTSPKEIGKFEKRRFVMTLNISVTDEQLGQFYRRTSAIAERLGKSLNFDDVMRTLKSLHDGIKKQILRRLYENEEILVGATNGEETIANSSDLFSGYLDPDFKKWGTNKSSRVSTEIVPAEIYELHKNATFQQMFDFPDRDTNSLCWEQGQIINFCRDHLDKLHPKGFANLFLFKVEGHEGPLVADVRSDAGGLEVIVSRFGRGSVWYAEGRDRVVVPQLVS
jgi:hypothetical protein